MSKVRTRLLRLGVAMVLALGACLAWGQTPSGITSKTAAPRVNQLELPVWLDQKEIAVLRVQLSQNRLLTVHRAQLYTLLAARLSPAMLNDLADIWANNHQTWLDPRQLNTSKVQLNYESDTVQLRLVIPLEARKLQTIALNENQRLLGTEASFVQPQALSLIVNNRLSLQTSHADSKQIQRLDVAQNLALRLAPWVLEAELKSSTVQNASASNQTTTHQLSHGDVSLTQDFPKTLSRLKLGDVTQRAMGSLNAQPMMGIHFERNYALDQQRKQLSRPAQTLSLPNGAAVDIYINGVLARSLRLEAGVHDLQQLPVNTGANEVSIRVTEPGKPPAWYSQNFFFHTALLAQNAHDFQWALGAPALSGAASLDGAKQYDWQHPQLTTSQRYGVTADVTLGAGAQLGQTAQQYYLETAAPLGRGLWSTELTLRNQSAAYIAAGATQPQSAAQSGWQGKTQWAWAAPRKPSSQWHSPSVNIQAVYRNGLYLDPAGLNAAHHELGLRLAAAHGQAHNASVSMRQNIYLDGYTRNVYATWTYKLNTDWSLDTVLAHTSKHRALSPTVDASLGKSLLITVRWHPKSEGFSNLGVIASYDPMQHKRSLDYNQHVATEDGLWRLSALTTQQAHDTTKDPITLLPTQSISATHLQVLRASYQHSRFEIDAQYDRYRYTQTGGVLPGSSQHSSENVALFAANAWGYAGGQWFTSRPIYDSAALIVVPPKLENAGVFVQDPHPAAAKQDGWGAPVVTPLMQAVSREVTLDADRLGKGQNFAEDRFWLKPSYRSLSIIALTLNPQTQITGQILNPQGKPAALLALLVKGSSPDEVYDVFTNRSGVYFTPALKPGIYTLTQADDTVLQRFQVEQDSPWKITLPALQLP